ncbi:MAG: acyl-CoA dehydrogenase family protein [Alphaproteobacteria bacterium]|jgi:alkylation response protein AidB-like acyl-CoA dehydrogenase|nr:acyl-CoA dehydrogenase family protein [Alphaproteobacteria bacterium]MDP6623694.1 acyl-CoA dehydrogenase family protein [Alphaproteobacteria bacterium]
MFDDEQREFRDHLARWVDDRLVPVAQELDEKGEFPRELFEELGGLGYFGVLYPEAYGGSGLDNRNAHYTILCEELARGSMGFAAIVCMHASTATNTVYQWGSEALRQKYLVPALRGEMVAGFALSEPDAGSDAAAIRTRAERTNTGYRLNGTKMFTSNGVVADFITVVATTDPEKGLKGMSLFLVDTGTKGFSVGRKLDKFTTHCCDSAELVLEDVEVSEECRLGDEDSGFLNAYLSLTIDRIFTAALALGTAQAAFDASVAYAKERQQFGKPIGKFQAVQFKLVDMLATLEQARIYTYYAAALADREAPITVEAALAKIVAADGANQVCQKALNIFGGYGLMNEFPVQRFLRDSYFPMIGGGTSDIMRMLIARQLGF